MFSLFWWWSPVEPVVPPEPEPEQPARHVLRYYTPPKRKPKVRTGRLTIRLAVDVRMAGRIGGRIRPARWALTLGAVFECAGDVDLSEMVPALNEALALFYDDFTVSVSDA